MICHKPLLATAYIFIAFFFMLYGCTPNSAYHKRAGVSGNCRKDQSSAECTEAYYQEYEGFDLAFAEYSDRGNAFNDTYIRDVLSRISHKAKDEGVILVTFVHGWKHNASESDDNLKDFKKTLQAVCGILKVKFNKHGLDSRRLIGLYVGWRGASITFPFLEQITYWDRKNIAEEVGQGGVTRLLLQLDQITNTQAKNVMVIVGHSLGGAIVVKALNDVLTDRVMNRPRGDSHSSIVGDGVIVVNPAIEANQVLPFVEAALKEKYYPNQHPLFISISSDSDIANHYAFPLGQTIGLMLTWRQTDLVREYYYDRLNPQGSIALAEEHLDTTTVGNFAPFLTHRISAIENDKATEFQVRNCDEIPKECRPRGLTSLDGLPTIRNIPQDFPLYFFKTDASVIENHNDIFNPEVRAFVITIIDDVIRRNLTQLDGRVQSSVLAHPDKFARRLNEMMQKIKGLKIPLDCGKTIQDEVN